MMQRIRFCRGRTSETPRSETWTSRWKGKFKNTPLEGFQAAHLRTAAPSNLDQRRGHNLRALPGGDRSRVVGSANLWEDRG
jgi:hypothetical protein